MARPTKPSGEVATIESKIAVLKAKLADYEHRHADALAALEDGREARRKLLTKDDKTVAEATRKVRELQFAADDAASLVSDYSSEIADAERRLAEAKVDDERETAAAILNAIAEAAAGQVEDFTTAAKAFMAARKRLLDAIPAGVGLLPGYHSHRPKDRPEGSRGPLSGRELVNAVVAESLCYGDPTIFDREFAGFGLKFTLSKLMDLRQPQPSYIGATEIALSPGEAIDALIIKPARERARQIMAGEAEPVLEDIEIIDNSKPPEVSKLEIIATKPLYFVAPSGHGHFRHHLSEGQRETVIEPIARLAIAKRAALELHTEAGQAFWGDFQQRLKAGQVHPVNMRSDTVDLGDPMGCLAPANDDEISEEVSRTLG